MYGFYQYFQQPTKRISLLPFKVFSLFQGISERLVFETIVSPPYEIISSKVANDAAKYGDP